jgi:hypothetical protein
MITQIALFIGWLINIIGYAIISSPRNDKYMICSAIWLVGLLLYKPDKKDNA